MSDEKKIDTEQPKIKVEDKKEDITDLIKLIFEKNAHVNTIWLNAKDEWRFYKTSDAVTEVNREDVFPNG